MWGSDYPHDEGTYPYTREHLRQRFADASEDELRAIVGGNAAALYGFDLDALAPVRRRSRPDRRRTGRAPHRAARPSPTKHSSGPEPTVLGRVRP